MAYKFHKVTCCLIYRVTSWETYYNLFVIRNLSGWWSVISCFLAKSAIMLIISGGVIDGNYAIITACSLCGWRNEETRELICWHDWWRYPGAAVIIAGFGQILPIALSGRRRWMLTSRIFCNWHVPGMWSTTWHYAAQALNIRSWKYLKAHWVWDVKRWKLSALGPMKSKRWAIILLLQHPDSRRASHGW